MKTPIRRLLLLAAALLPAASLEAQDEAPAPLKALLVTGGCCHDYEQQKEILPVGLSARANVEFTVVHEGGDSRDHKVSIYENPDWAEGYDVIIHNECFGGVKDVEFIENIARPHAEGVPAVLIHCSVHSYRHTETDAWREVTGAKSMEHEPARDFAVKKIDHEHPVMAGFPDNWTAPDDELYIILKEWPNVTPLATADGVESEKTHPVIWVNTVGKGRVFATTLGHGNQTVGHPVFLDLVARGLLWATGHLNDDGTPKEGYGPVSE